MPLPQGFREWLSKESQRWHEGGLLASDQRERILALYPEETGSSGRLAFALRTLGVLLLGAAVLLVISHNWSDLSRTGRLATVVIALIALQGIGLWYSLRAKATGSVLGHLAGCIMFGAAIALTGQIYHLDAHSPDAILAWCLGTLPFALLLDSALLHIGTVILAGTWLIMETGDGLFGHRSVHLDAYRLAFYALILPTAVAAYRNPRPVLAGAVAWACAFAWFQFWGKLPAELFVLPLAIAALHAPGDPRARGWRFIGGLGVSIITIVLGNLNHGLRNFFEMGAVMTTAVALIAALAIYRSLRQQGSARNWPAWIALITLGLCLLNELTLPAQELGWVWTVSKAVANAATIALSIWLLRLGLAEGRLRPYVYGSLVFLAWLIARYVDIGRSMSMLTLAGFFAVIGVILFALARVWRTQKDSPEPEAMEAFAPGWLETWAAQVRPHRLQWLLVAAFVQVGVIGWMVYHHHQPLRHGQRFLIRCQPVDPRDLLKGDYVILSYDFSRFTEKDIKRLNAEWKQLKPGQPGVDNFREYGLVVPNDTPIYVPLTSSGHGVAEAGEATLLRPSSGAYLRGLVGRGSWAFNSARFGIEAFYVTEGTGSEWEKARNQGQLLAEIGVLPNGRAGLIGLKKAEMTVQTVDFRKLENYFLAEKEDAYRTLRVLQDSAAFEKVFHPAAVMGKPMSPPDFTKEIVVSYARPPTQRATELAIDRIERRERTLVVFVREVTGEKQSFSTRPQVAAKVERGSCRTVEFRSADNRLLQRIDL